ncbi:MAG TPA: hypothetical protein VMH83_00245 [Candidatus Acidoferrum sp.]|nr:hypothetical protein [Candidatus Acidoferrum sp.]
MRIPLITVVVGILLAGQAQAQPVRQLPPDVNPVSLTRLPPLARDDLDDAGKAVYDNIVGNRPAPKMGPVALSLYSPPIAQVFNDLNGYLRNKSVVSQRYIEVAITLATREIEQNYEYSAHAPAAVSFGAPQAVVDTIRDNREPVGLPAEETVIIKLGRAIMRQHKVDSALYAEAEKLFGRRGVVELITAMGDYMMVGMIMTAIDQQLPENRPGLLPAR